MQDVYVTTHAQEQAIKRFDFIHDRGQAIDWVTNEMKDATYFGEVLGKDGRKGRMYVHEAHVFIVDAETPRVCTTYEPNRTDVVGEQVRKYVEKLVGKENKEYSLELRELDLKIKQAQLDYAQADLDQAKATKKADKEKYETLKQQYKQFIELCKKEVADREQKHAQYLKDCASYYA